MAEVVYLSLRRELKDYHAMMRRMARNDPENFPFSFYDRDEVLAGNFDGLEPRELPDE